MPLRKTDGGQRGGIFRLVAALNLEAPTLDGSPCCERRAVVSRENIRQSFGLDQIQRDLQSLQKIRRRRVREEEALRVRSQHVVPAKKTPR